MNRFEMFTILISKINKNIKKIKNLEMAEYNLRSMHVSCLFYLYINETLTASDLCEKCAEDKATISRTLDYLEENDYVLCNSNLVKRYNSPFTLTEKGKTIGKKVFDKINEVLKELNGCLTEEERIQFYNHLNKICYSLEEITDKIENNGGTK